MAANVPVPLPDATAARHSRRVFWIILAASLLDMIDWGILQVALPSIGTQFRVGLEETQWVMGGYGITMAGCLMLSGRAGDKFGHGHIFLWGVAILGAASLAGGISNNIASLIGARLIQGVGAAMSSVAALAIFMGLFPDERERNRFFGILMAATGVGFALGNALGGIMTSAFGWRSVLYVQAPVALAITMAGASLLGAEKKAKAAVSLDIAGGLALTAGLLLLVYALTNTVTHGFAGLAVILPFGAAIAAFAIFARIERTRSQPTDSGKLLVQSRRRSCEPVVSPVRGYGRVFGDPRPLLAGRAWLLRNSGGDGDPSGAGHRLRLGHVGCATCAE